MSHLARVGRWQLKLTVCHKIYQFFLDGSPNYIFLIFYCTLHTFTSLITNLLKGKSTVHDKWTDDVGIILYVPCYALPHSLLVVLKRHGHLLGHHNHLNACLGPYCGPWTLVPSADLVQQNDQGINENFQGQAKIFETRH